jgi:hypothetical protein
MNWVVGNAQCLSTTAGEICRKSFLCLDNILRLQLSAFKR